LPGGPTFVHSGLILAADNEAQLAGVIAHEISHVALRHGTNQAPRLWAYSFWQGCWVGQCLASPCGDS
jgi:predicted Zn-dependent protease